MKKSIIKTATLTILFITTIVLFQFCSEDTPVPIPQNKIGYIGVWKNPKTRFALMIKPNGIARIRQDKAFDNEKGSLNIKVAPAKIDSLFVEFKEGNILSLSRKGLYAREYKITKFVTKDGERMTFSLDGTELERFIEE